MKRRLVVVRYIIALVAAVLVIGVLVLIFGRMDKTIEAYGIVVPAYSFGVKPRVDGIVEKIFVKEGDSVEAGDTLAVLQADELRFEGEKARQALAQAQANLAQINEEYRNLVQSKSFETQSAFANLYQARRTAEIAREKYERSKKLFERNLISAEENEDARLAYELAESNLRALEERANLLEKRYILQISEREKAVELAKKELELATQRLGQAVIVSPIDGEVLTPRVEALVGERVSGGKTLIEIGDCSKVDFLAEVKESDAPYVEVGQKARIFINAFPHRKYRAFSGSISGISSTPRASGGAVVFETRVRIDDPTVEVGHTSQSLRPGLTGKAKITTKPNARLVEIVFGVKK